MSSIREKQQPSPYAEKPWLKHYDYWVPEQTNFARQPVHQMLNLAAAQIVDLENGVREVPQGQEGELCIRGPQVMKGYWNKPEETVKTIRDGWLYTGDVARMDEDGYFYIVQRKKDLILVSGFNVYPTEVEEVLFTHAIVKEAAVIGVNDPYRGELVKAFVVLKEDAQPASPEIAEELTEYCRSRLARYKVPSTIEFIASLPKSAVGKVLRRELKEAEDAKQ